MAPGENNKTTMDIGRSREDDSTFSDMEKSGPMAEIDEDEPDETLGERLWGLTEMFPEPVRNFTDTVFTKSIQGIKGLYSFSRSAVWIVVSSSVILFAPVIFEVERAQMEDMQRTQQKQVLLGPNTALAGGQGVPMPPISR